MKKTTLILAGLMCLPMVGFSSAWGEGDSDAAEQGRVERGPETRGTALAIDWHSIDGGGVMFSTGGGMTLGGTLGQADAGGPMTGGTLSLTGGFWVVAASSAAGCANTCGDINGSGGNIDLVDFATLAVCFGQSPSSSAGCACSDMNDDGSINLLDFATFGLLFGTASTDFPPNCTP